MKKEEWIWMGHAGHFILGDMCRFRLNTYVGKYIVSTVGEYVPDSQVRNILVKSRENRQLPKGDVGEAEYIKKYKCEELGVGRKYETMVFKSRKSKNKCCPFEIIVSEEVDFSGYNSAEEATKGHLELCEKWSKEDNQ